MTPPSCIKECILFIALATGCRATPPQEAPRAIELPPAAVAVPAPSQPTTSPQVLRTARALADSGVATVASLVQGCVDPLGNTVVEIPNPGLNDIAMATVWYGRPAIIFNPLVVGNSHPAVARFFYVHECGHHVLGHVIKGARGVPVDRQDEAAADCFSVSQLIGAGEFQLMHVQIVQQRLAGNPGDATHDPGPLRSAKIGQCAQSAMSGGL